MSDGTIDLERLIGEIDDEVQRRRAAGDLDRDTEQTLDEMFAAGAPPGVVGDFPRLLDAAERAAFIDPAPPVSSDRPGGDVVKRALGRTMSWYVANVVHQVTTLGTDLVEALRVLGERVTHLETAIEPAGGTIGSGPLLEPHLDTDTYVAAVVASFHPVTGRVLHAEAADGRLLQALIGSGLDAYGVEPRSSLAEAAAVRGLDVREQGAAEHLASVPPDALGGIVLSGCVDTVTNREREQLVQSARRTLVPGGPLVVVASNPDEWGGDATRIAADLSAGRPWHADTWSYCLDRAGFAGVSVSPGRSGAIDVITAAR